MEFFHALPLYGEAFLRLFYPSSCASCDQLLELEEEGVCLSCRDQLQKLRFLPSEERIRVSLAYGDEAWSLYRYEDPLKEILHQIKFRRRRRFLGIFKDEIAHFLKRRPELAAYDLILPIPLDRKRRVEREFNQSGLLAKKFHNSMKMPESPSQPRLEPRILAKKFSTPPQSLLGKEARRSNLQGVFHVRRPHKIRNRSILLMDDIFTTGATLEEAAKTLKNAGASRVGYLTLARALSR